MPNLFRKITFDQALEQYQKFPVSLPGNPKGELLSTHILKALQGLGLPRKAYEDDAGYDVRTPFGFKLYPGEVITLPLFINCELKSGRYLSMVPRSGQGFEFLRVANIFPVIDKGFFPKPIALRLRNESTTEAFKFDQFDRVAQALILFHDTLDDGLPSLYGSREGGLGSSGVK